MSWALRAAAAPSVVRSAACSAGAVLPAAGGASDGQVYGLTADTAPNPPPLRGGSGTAFAGLAPDGKLYVASGATLAVGPQLQGGLKSNAVHLGNFAINPIS